MPPLPDDLTGFRLLVVDADASQVRGMIEQLRHIGLAPTFEVVQEESEYRRALETFRPQVVVAAYRLPRFSGRRALKLARALDPELPVILVTETLSPQNALRFVRLGLADYVSQDRISHLGPAVLQALSRGVARRNEDTACSSGSLDRKLRAWAETSGDGMLIVDSRRRIVFCNEAAKQILEAPREHTLDADAATFVAEEHRAAFETVWTRVTRLRKAPSPFTVEVMARKCSGVKFLAEVSVSAWDDEDGRFFAAFLRDVSAYQEQARALNLVSAALEQSTNVVLIADQHARIVYVNPAFERTSGFTAAEILGRDFRTFQHDERSSEAFARMWSQLTRGGTFTTEFVNRRKDGSKYIQRWNISPIVGRRGRVEHCVAIGEDVTQERHLERQLRQAQKMEAMGLLTGGIAHDFNNHLTAIIGHTQLLLEELSPGHGRPGELATEILVAAERAAELVRRLLVFSRRESAKSGAADVRSALDELLSMARRILPETIEVTVEHAPEPLLCSVDAGELQHAILNLITNARDAMPEGGSLRIATRRGRTTRGEDRVLIEVSDTGQGIPKSAQDRIFEPFYTTKPAGTGTGLGLAMVSGFVRRVGGEVTVASEEGRGSTFCLSLPPAAAEASAPSDRDTTGGAKATHPPPRGTETVLIAEDQREIRELGRQILQRLGYTVLTAADGAEAREVLQQHRGTIALVVSDLVMPGGGGQGLLQSVQDWDRPPHFLFMSGYSPTGPFGLPESLRGYPFLAKPWSVEQFAAAVRNALDLGRTDADDTRDPG